MCLSVGEEDVLAPWVGVSAERRTWWHQSRNASPAGGWTFDRAFGHPAPSYVFCTTAYNYRQWHWQGPQLATANFSKFLGPVCQIPWLTTSNFPHILINFYGPWTRPNLQYLPQLTDAVCVPNNLAIFKINSAQYPVRARVAVMYFICYLYRCSNDWICWWEASRTNYWR